MLVRKAQLKDCDTIARMVTAAGREDGRGEPTLSADLVRAHGFGPSALFEAWLAEDAHAGRSTGCAIAYKGYDVHAACATLVVATLYVAPEARSSGVARRLIAQAAERAFELGARGLTIATGVDNAVARAFFSSIGATESRSAVFVLGRDQIEWLAAEHA